MTDSVDTIWQEAWAASEQKRWEEAVELWREFTRRDSDEPNGFVNLGAALFHTEQYDAAMAASENALRLNPDDADAHSWLGLALSKAGQPDAAFEHWQEAARLDPRQVEARYNVGCALYTRGEHEAAVEQWREVLRLKPSDWEAHRALGSAYVQKAQKSHSRKDWRLAWDAYKQAAKCNPQKDADTLYWLGHLEWKFGNRRSAEHIMKAAVDADPDYQRAYEELVRMQFYLGHWQESMQTVRASPTFDPDACQICVPRLVGVLAAVALLAAGVLVWSRRCREDAS